MSRTIDVISKLVEFDTVSRNSNLQLIDWVREYLAQFEVASHIIESPDGKKANLLATIGPAVAGGVVLSGHTDVVPVDDQVWNSDPFKVTQRDARLYGRGTCDMKGFVGISLAKVPDMLKADLKKPIHLAFSYDEEVGCIGAKIMAPQMPDFLPDIKAVIVGEPSEMKVVEQHKGFFGAQVQFDGIEAHSSLPFLGVSANVAAAKFMAALIRMDEEFAEDRLEGSLFTPPHATVNIGRVSGGTASNIIPNRCTVDLSVRLMPGADTNKLISRLRDEIGEVREWMRQQNPDCDVKLEFEPETAGLSKEAAGEAAMLCRRLSGDNSDNVVSYGTEGGVFQKAGYSAVVCGPGSIEQAHKPDEFIEVSQIRACETFIGKLINEQAA